MHKLSIAILSFATLLASCKSREDNFDASGSFEAEETIISSEATGALLGFDVEEGMLLQQGQTVGYIDSAQLYLKKLQLQSQIGAVLSRKPNVPVQLSALQAQLATAEREQRRILNLVNDGAIPRKQLDDANAQVTIIKKQIAAQRSSLNISTEGISKETNPIKVQIAQLDDQIAKCRVINPIQGTVLAKYASRNEMAVTGKPLYKIADLSTLILRAYITGNQLPQIKLNQQLQVLTDDGKGGFKATTGILIWISNQAEFTPKTIQTKDERANMVYAIKVKVKNDGAYKIGMYGAVKFL